MRDRGDLGRRAIVFSLCAFAVATVLGPGPASIALGVLVVSVAVQMLRREIRLADVPRDTLLYVAVFAWKSCTRALATSLREGAKVRSGWWRVPYVAVGTVTIDRRALLRVLHTLFAANVVLVVLAVAQHTLGGPTFGTHLFDRSSPARLQGFTGHPNSYAGCIAIVLLLNVGVALFHERRFFAYTPLLAAGLLLSGSRGYVFGVTGGLVVLAAMTPSFRRSRRSVGIGLLVIAVAAIAIVATPGLSRRLGDSLAPDRNTYRVTFWDISWTTFREHPIVGIGSGLLPARLAPHEAAGEIDNRAQAHSLYLQELAEDGVVGFVLVTGAYVYFLLKCLRVHRRTQDRALAGLSLGAAAGVVALLLEGLFDDNFGNAIVAFVLNLALGLVEGHRRGVVEPEP